MSILGFRLRQRDVVALPPEIGFLLAQGFPPAPLAKAAAIARASGTDAATALLNGGLMDEATFYAALARELGAPFLTDAIPLGTGALYPDGIVAGVAPLAPGSPAPFVFAPRGRAIVELLEGSSPAGRIPAVTTPTALREAVFAANPDGIAACAADGLQVRRPDWAFKSARAAPLLVLAGLVVGAFLAACASLPVVVVSSLWTLVQLGFLALVTFRVAALRVPSTDGPDAVAHRLSDADLPVYTVFVALHREAPVVPRLVKALASFDYPVAKLDIKFLVEAHDAETAAALSAMISGAMIRSRDHSSV